MRLIRPISTWLNRYKHHILIWLLIWIILKITNPLEGEKLWADTLIPSVIIIGYATVFYTTSLYILPFFRDKKILRGTIGYLLLGVCYEGHVWILWEVIFPAVGVVDTRSPYNTSLVVLTTLYVMLTIAGSSYFWHRQVKWRLERERELEKKQLALEKKQLEDEKALIEKDRLLMEVEKSLVEKSQLLLKTEKHFLNNQFNEHTIFNFLNSLYRKVYRQVPEAGESIILFSDLLSYSLRVEFDKVVPLEKEVEYINNYIEIQRTLKKALSLQFSCEGSLSHVQVPPYVLFPFVENAFKHGVVNDAAYPLKINLSINGNIDFRVTNRKSNQAVRISGIGQKNAQQVLDSYFPQRYHLDIQDELEEYTIHLTIDYDH